MTAEHDERRTRGRYRAGLWLILVVSYGLRMALAFSGGQGFWPDEQRYSSAQDAAYRLLHRHWKAAADKLLGQADHMLFRWVALPPAFLEQAAGPHPAWAAAYFAFFSVLAIALIWAVARRAGAGESEALWAAFLAACANSLFYFSRHFFPYDIALCAMLAALWLALGRWSALNSLRVGVVVGLGFLTYNGYWVLGGVVLMLHTLLGDGGPRRAAFRAAWSGAGLLLTLTAIVGLGLALGYRLIDSFLHYAGNVIQGDFHLAYRLIPEYLWYAEGGVFLVWLAGLGYALGWACRHHRCGRLAWYGGGILLMAGILIFFSDVVPKFMVHGRLTRQLVPFLCLGAAFGIEKFLERMGGAARRVGVAIALVLAICAAVNFSRPLRQVFPDGFHRMAMREIERQQRESFGFYQMLFAESLWGKRLDLPPRPYPVILRRQHPMQFRPYQYEGYSAAQRAAINGHDVSMRLMRLPVALSRSASSWDGYPGPVRLNLAFRADNPVIAEPLVTTGRPGAGDFLFVRYDDPGHVSFGVDQWGGRAQLSEPVAINFRRRHDLVLSAGCLLPPEGSPFYARFPARASWPRRLLVILDGRIVLSSSQEFFPVPPNEILFGINPIGGSTAQPNFSGEVFGFESAAPETIERALSRPSVPARPKWP